MIEAIRRNGDATGPSRFWTSIGRRTWCSDQALYTDTRYVAITLGPSDPSTGDPDNNPQGWTWNGPLIAVGTADDGLYRCDLSSGTSGEPDVVASLNAPGTPVESTNWSGIRALFD